MVRGVDVAVLDFADLTLEVCRDVVEVFEIGLGDRRFGREVVVGVCRLEEHVGHERTIGVALVDEVEHLADIDLVALPRIGAALALMQVGRVHLRENGLVERREGEALAGVEAELVVLLLHHIHQHGRTTIVEHREPVGAVQAVEHRKDAHLRQVAAAVVLLKAHRLFGELPGLRHDFRVEHVEAQRFGDQPDDVGRACRSVDDERRQWIVERTLSEIDAAFAARLLLDAERLGDLAHRERQVEGIAFAGEENRLVIGRGTVGEGDTLADGGKNESEDEPAPAFAGLCLMHRASRIFTHRGEVIGAGLHQQQRGDDQRCGDLGALARAKRGDAAGR